MLHRADHGGTRVTTLDPAVQVTIARTREDVAMLHEELVRHDLVVWTSGTVSARVPGADLFVIKPSGVAYDSLSPENLVLCTFDGTVVRDTPGWGQTPSTDAALHGRVYRSLPQVGGIVHTHSTYATAWATLGEPVPCVTTTMAKEFGGEIPLVGIAAEGDDGAAIIDALGIQRSAALLLQNHGLFTVGETAGDAVRRAVLAEDAARTAHAARTLGELIPLPTLFVDDLFEAATTTRTRLTAGVGNDTA